MSVSCNSIDPPILLPTDFCDPNVHQQSLSSDIQVSVPSLYKNKLLQNSFNKT